jgi:hypothetical protein
VVEEEVVEEVVGEEVEEEVVGEEQEVYNPLMLCL